jgi:predicted N-acetyltransferase YhbS
MSVVHKIREATEADHEAVAALINRAFEVEKFFKSCDRTTPEEILHLLHKGTFLLAEDAAGALLGSIYVETGGARGYFGMLSVQPGRQRGGIGRQLIAAAEQRARQAGCTFMEISVIDLREELPPLYGRFGYELDGDSGEIDERVQPHLKMPVRLLHMRKTL